MKRKYSIIVPVYNVEKYINECLSSLINQTYKNIEIVVINDGSSDNSLSLIEEYSRIDDRIRVIDQKNMGLGYTRNVGIDNAVGDYILFVDSDDYISLNTCEEIEAVLSYNNEVDIIVLGRYRFADEVYMQDPISKGKTCFETGESYLLHCVKNECFTASSCNKMDYDKLADAITEKTKVVLPVDLAGVVCDYDKIFAAVESKKHLFSPVNDIQKAYGRVIVLADAAHAFGAKWHGKMCGEIADFTSFSFHAVKNLTTAEGGALTWRNHDGVDNESLYKQFQLLSLHGQNKDALAKTRLGAWEYDIVAPYYKCNMTDVMAGIGLAQLKRYPEMLYRRRQIIERYNEGLRGCDVQVLDHFGDDHSSSGHLYLVRLLGEDVEYRNAVIERMAERGIACNVHYKPLPMMTAYKNLGFDIVDYPNAYNQYHNEITLPLHTSLTNEDVEYVISNFVDIITQ